MFCFSFYQFLLPTRMKLYQKMHCLPAIGLGHWKVQMLENGLILYSCSCLEEFLGRYLIFRS